MSAIALWSAQLYDTFFGIGISIGVVQSSGQTRIFKILLQILCSI